MKIFVTGGTGYIGSRLIPLLASRGHQAKALVRPGVGEEEPPGALGIPGGALRSTNPPPRKSVAICR
jgi:uncharacterized protein YbjT (DUF2867 family)